MKKIKCLVQKIRKKAVIYGVKTKVFVFLYLISFIPYYLGIYLILKGAGVLDISFAQLIQFDLKEIELKGSLIVWGFLINRISWALPYLYIQIKGRKKLPWYIHGLIWLWIILSVLFVLLF